MSDVSGTVRARLEAERERLTAQLRDLHAAEGTFDTGFADTSQVTAERGEIETLAGSLSELLRDVEDAVAKVDAGTYGVCESCGGAIGEARLEAMPSARRCISCASARR
jgi:DnaK suppressor protein